MTYLNGKPHTCVTLTPGEHSALNILDQLQDSVEVIEKAVKSLTRGQSPGGSNDLGTTGSELDVE